MGNPDPGLEAVGISGNAGARRDWLRVAGPWVLDGLLAVVMAAAGFALLTSALPFDPGSPPAWAAYLLVAAHTLPIAVRRRYPLPALAWALLTGVAFAALGLNLVVLSVTILVYVYTAAARCPRRVSLAGLAATEALLLVVWLANPGGDRRRRHRGRRRADHGRRLVAGRRDQADSMSIIAVQSGVGAHVLDSQPEEARKALAAVEATLTNVVRHAGPATARVAVRHGPARVTLEVVDDGRGGDPGRDHGRHGIAGMRERAELYGGPLEAGPRPGGGFRVAASLPVGAP